MKKSIDNYPFIKIVGDKMNEDQYTDPNPRVWFSYFICGNPEPYKRWDYDQYIDDAIDLASKWHPSEITYERILHLRSWLRENEQHNHQIHFNNVRTLEGCRKLIYRIIDAEYRYMAGPERTEEIRFQKEHTDKIFA